MCARFTLKSSSDVVGSLFGLDDVPELLPRYNIAPTQDILGVVSVEGKRISAIFRWGLIPSWAKDSSLGQKMINARSETASEKPSFRTALRKRRCLIVCDGFYEWTDPDEDTAAYVSGGSLFGGEPLAKKKDGKLPRQPWWIGRKDRQPFAFAGLWELNQLTELGSVETCCILTTSPNDLLEPMHDRMPVILDPKDWGLWLDSNFSLVPALESLMVPCPSEEMETFKVTPKVNSPRAYGAELIDPLPLAG
jgi:putative SOS response-associated peptidase YedK